MNSTKSTNSHANQPLELWGGLECTVNRVQDTYFHQLDRNGHAGRADDIERFASLGIRAIRYPILWERTRPSLADPDWFLKVRSGHGAAVRVCEYTNYCEGLDQHHDVVTC